VQEIPQVEVQRRLQAAFPHARCLFEDAKYRIVSLATMRTLINSCWVKEEPYVSEYFDCDKYATLFKAILAVYYHLNSAALVLNYTGQHSFNVIIVKEGVFILEPQTGQIWPAANAPQPRYKVDGEILLV
jgi:hypothetical protein